MRVTLAALAAAALAAAAAPASAQIAAQVVPVKCTLAGQPGEVIEREILVENRSETPVVVELALSDWTLGARGDLHLLAAPSGPRSLAGLVQVEPATFSLPALESRSVRLAVTVPADGPPARWGVVLSRFRPATPGSLSFGSTAVAEVGTTIYLSRADAGAGRAEIVGMSAVPAGGDSLALEVRVRSEGERAMYFRAELALVDASGATSQRWSQPTTVLLPGSERVLAWTVAAPACAGGCRAVCSIDSGEPTLLVGELPLTWPPSAATPLARRSEP
jgi:hypothetical protein